MTLIEGIGDEVTHFFIGVLLITVVSLAWWTTNISEQRQFHTVWLLDRRRHHRLRRRFTNHTHTVTISEATSNSISTSESETISVQESEITTTNTTPTVSTIMPKPPEEPSTSNSQQSQENQVEEEQDRIVQVMDDDETCIVRQRRLKFYTKDTDSHSDNTITTTSNTSDQPNTDIRIRLKYINDDLRMVDGRLEEKLGDFKKRHFQVELSSNKLVRLIFNGQVLQQDSRTLENCGFFDNCVVHCLIHQKRPQQDDAINDNNRNDNINSTSRRNSNNQNLNINNGNDNNNNQGRDWDLGNFLFALITFTLLSAWYFRYVYAHLYTVTATVGLILMTGVFSIVLFGFYFPEQEHIPAERIDNL